MSGLRPAFCVLAALALQACSPSSQAEHRVISPDGRIALSVMTDPNGRLLYRIQLSGADIIAWSPVGLLLQKAATADEPLVRFRIVSVESQNDSASDVRFSTMRVHAEQLGTARKFDLEARAYDGGAAFRLKLPAQPNLPSVQLRRELTAFSFAADYACLGVRQTRYVNSHEGEYDPIRASAIKPDMMFDLPLVCQTGRAGETFALAESDIETYSGAYLAGRSDRGLGVEVKLAPRHDNPSLAVSAPMPSEGFHTPWRAVLIADRPERLIESTLVADLAPPSRIGDTSWISPGKAAWGWWSGQLAKGLADPGSNDDTYKHYIDFAQRFGLRYLMIDEGWAYRDRSDAAGATLADIMRTTDKVNLPELIDYAQRRGVRIWLWVNWKALDPRMEEAFAFYQRLGVAGFKVDFLDRQDQEMVAFYHRLLSTAARHHLMVDVHGSFVPRGLDRTYPNYMTQEGVLALEYNRWSRRATAAHDVRLAFTRAIIGPMDYTPGGFRNVAPENFAPRSRAPQTMTTRAHQIALFVAYPSPFSMLADSPGAYEDAQNHPVPGADFLKIVPTVWDETRGIAGDFGRYIVMARRSGHTWYMAALTDEQGRDLTIPLDFLGPGNWHVESWTDGGPPTEVKRSSGDATRSQPLKVRLAARGGAAWILSPVP